MKRRTTWMECTYARGGRQEEGTRNSERERKDGKGSSDNSHVSARHSRNQKLGGVFREDTVASPSTLRIHMIKD
ncbi:hypothetical protein MRX96_056199 [Rhipicephalus microplus]